jgi:hypothetical protein
MLLLINLLLIHSLRVVWWAENDEQRKQFVEIIKELGIEHTVYGKMEVMADEDFIYLSSF